MLLNHFQNNTPFETKPISFFDKTLVSGFWYCIFLNEKVATIHASLCDEAGAVHHTLNWDVPEEIVEQWDTDNSVVTKAFLEAKGWNIE